MRRSCRLARTVIVALVPLLAVLSDPWSVAAQEDARSGARPTRRAAHVDEAPGRGAAEQERRADDRRGEPGTEEETSEGPPDIPRREVPNYDGRPDPGQPPEDMVLWIPRVLTYPIHAVVEYLARRPVGWVLTVGEHQHWDAIQIPPVANDDPSWGIVPTILADFGSLTSGGLYLWLDDVLARGNALRLQLSFGGVDWLRATVLDRIRIGEQATLDFRADGWMRPDYMFVGIGPDIRLDRFARYARRQLGGEVGVRLRTWRASHIRLAANVQANEFSDTTYVGLSNEPELTISDAVAQGWYPNMVTLPPGFEGYIAYRQRLEAAVDTRDPSASDGTGARLEAYGELGLDLKDPLSRRWIRWGGGVGGFVDIDRGRTIALWMVTELATRLGPADVPFTELPDLGGRGRMVAFRRGFLIGESIIGATLEYRYPIWIAAQGFASVSVGNAFGANLDGFAAEQLRMSFALGLRTTNSVDNPFTVQVGFGTDTFAQGLDPAIIRLTAGTQEGF